MVVKIKAKGTKNCVIKRKLKFENYKNYLEATLLDDKIKYLEKNKINIDSLKKDHKQFIRNNKSIIKYSKDLKVKDIMFLLNKLTRLL